jgi:hypothetical protein
MATLKHAGIIQSTDATGFAIGDLAGAARISYAAGVFAFSNTLNGLADISVASITASSAIMTATLRATTVLGYTTGAGGTVTQLTSRTTGVILNKATGGITLFSAAGSATPATFTVTNSLVAATDTIVVNQKSGTDLYDLKVTAVRNGSFDITFNTTGGTTTEQPVFSFAILEGVTS